MPVVSSFIYIYIHIICVWFFFIYTVLDICMYICQYMSCVFFSAQLLLVFSLSAFLFTWLRALCTWTLGPGFCWAFWPLSAGVLSLVRRGARVPSSAITLVFLLLRIILFHIIFGSFLQICQKLLEGLQPTNIGLFIVQSSRYFSHYSPSGIYRWQRSQYSKHLLIGTRRWGPGFIEGMNQVETLNTSFTHPDLRSDVMEECCPMTVKSFIPATAGDTHPWNAAIQIQTLTQVFNFF